MTKLVCLMAILAGAATAHADSVGPATPAERGKSEGFATGLSIAGSLAGPALIVGAIAYGDSYDSPLHAEFWPMMATGVTFAMFGPSLGEWYAGKGLSRGLTLRIAGAGAFAIGASMFVSSLFSNDSAGLVGGIVGIVGFGAVATGTVLDVYDAHTTARDYNRTHVQLGIAPTARGHGLALVGTF